ncbi:F0F1 ATP synthase subunit delta [Tepidibacter formicigenes]|jgi:F-type H+-transporting ATPase subunit delta|uniref:ATP synthase subunit delta n=1 Tax=Tepidibacter formicigenes DSM 15518 TaxID=1123349 RepID=A0A1M6MQZ7_9FIRM|nr:F0F1 ATP synthase subunit delta [Tepidibacter formicigenes]SHJ85901.1 F-type H+-transporting ATPase subunit delta [Tepidibacter formicigenes DSM 15518]
MAKLVASRYANALFEVGIEGEKLELLNEELKTLVDVFKENEDFLNVLKAPLVSKQEKKVLVENIYNNRASLEMVNFLKVLIDKDRIGIINEIFDEFKTLMNNKNNIKEAVAVTAVPMKEKALKELQEKLTKTTGKNIVLKNEVDESVLGGVLVKMGNEEIDGTLKTRLEKLKDQLSQIIA